MAAAALLACAAPAFAQTQTVAIVDGTILASDGARILYVPTGRPNDLRIRLADGQEQIVIVNALYRPTYGFLTANGAIFSARVPAQVSDRLFTFDGATVQAIASLNSNNSLVARGNYAVFSGDTSLPSAALQYKVYWMNTATGQIVLMPGQNGNIFLDVAAQGTIAYWTAEGYSGPDDPMVDYNIVAFDGVSQRRITDILGPVFNVSPVTDGTNFVFVRTGVCCSSNYSMLILSNGVTETVLQTGGPQGLYPGRDYQINAGWVAYRDTNFVLKLRSPTGATSEIAGAGFTIVSVSEHGDVVFRRDTEFFLRLASGETIDIGAYSSAFNVGQQWYFYADGRLVRYANGQLVALDSAFAANANPYAAVSGTTLYGVSDISVERPISLAGQTTLDTRAFNIVLSGPLSGAGSLDVRGGGMLTLLGANSYTGGTSIIGATLIGNSTSLQGAIANSGALVFDQGFDGSFHGMVTGSGTVRKTGAGMLTLAGAQPYSGTTTIDGGGIRLQAVDSPSPFQLNAGQLAGTGRIGGLSATGGTIRPGAPGAVIASTGGITLGSGATYVADLASGGVASQLTTTSNAALGGAKLALALAPGTYRLGDSWTILTAGSISGGFTMLPASGPRLLMPALSIGSTSVRVQLVLDRPAFTALAETPNQAAVAGAVAQLPVTSMLLGNLITLPDSGIRRTLSALRGEVHGSTASVLADSTLFVRGALADRLAADMGGIWGSAVAGRSRIEASGDLSGLRQRQRDYVAGVDAEAASGVGGGAAIWYGNADSDGRAGKLHHDQIGAGIYGRARLGPVAFRAMASRTWFDLNTDRQVAFAGSTSFSERLTGKSTATSTDGIAEVTLPMKQGGATIAPFAGLRYQRIQLDRLSEAGGEASLVAGRQVTSQVSSRVGGEGNISLPVGGIRASASWEHALSRPDGLREMALPAAAGAEFALAGLGRPADLFAASLNAEFAVSDWRLGAGVHYQLGGRYETVGARLTASLGF